MGQRLRGQHDSSGRLPKQLVIVMRHGERQDAVSGAPPEADPPLTKNGLADVADAARELVSFIGRERAHNLLLIVSPFLRTLQTADELRRNNIGIKTPQIVDNSICEVFGPLRIKSGSRPTLTKHSHKMAKSLLPQWGETIELASQRYVAALHLNAREYPNRDLLFVTHGDAVGAITNHFYPMRLVYETEYLSFVILQKRGSFMYDDTTRSRYKMLSSHGVRWLLEGPEQSEEEDSEETPRDHVASARPTVSGDITVCEPFHTGESEHGATCETGLISGDGGPHPTTRSQGLPCIFRLLAVLSQFFVLIFWDDVRNARIYSFSVFAVELLFFLFTAGNLYHPGLCALARMIECYPVNVDQQHNGQTNCFLYYPLRMTMCTLLKCTYIFIFANCVSLFIFGVANGSLSFTKSYFKALGTVPGVCIFLTFSLFCVLRAYFDTKHIRNQYVALSQ
ncbi:putative Histidine phosphatase superfamily (branch 1) [Trypanosoma vivax]|uniref:Uncharacterized protein n=1 Tax=Trypanosoma vivax (strain Y486) TaxID=1055687 RepID=G0U3B4_TRYVY|nr:hypothetical protein TRVL_00911 [Trypanosoma vivax]KAH8604358.1 putative Histidine phosphatase superfamily (branch 1) [Trypanosoma vivax]CCC50770.1 conserved hypothetical protein [Trypanosoma vivax Y486]